MGSCTFRTMFKAIATQRNGCDSAVPKAWRTQHDVWGCPGPKGCLCGLKPVSPKTNSSTSEWKSLPQTPCFCKDQVMQYLWITQFNFGHPVGPSYLKSSLCPKHLRHGIPFLLSDPCSLWFLVLPESIQKNKEWESGAWRDTSTPLLQHYLQ